jgi:hypothetical protein
VDSYGYMLIHASEAHDKRILGLMSDRLLGHKETRISRLVVSA